MADNTSQQNRQKRLEQQLRANLQRRKAQARERSQDVSAHEIENDEDKNQTS